MSYQTYITDAVVLQSYDSNTADRTYRLFTRHAGLVIATAKSVREERSRQRYALQDFSYSTVSLIRGKAGWRIGSVESQRNFFLETSHRAIRKSILNMCRTIRQYVHGEEPHPELFATTLEGLVQMTDVSHAAREAWEACYTARILALLGYVAVTPDVSPLLYTKKESLSDDILIQALPQLEQLISKAEESSHLSA
jgi:recombinational DNA repair protein (RecF pathway)